MQAVSLTHPVLVSFFFFFRIWIVSLTYPLLALFLSGEFLPNNLCWLHFLSGEFLLHIPCWLCFYVVSLCYTSRVTFIFIWEGLCGEFLLHIPCCLHFYLERFMWGVSLTHPVLPSFVSGKVYVGSFSYTSRVAFIFIWEGLCGEFLLHIPCCLHFYLGSFSYTSRVAFIFIWEVSLTHSVLVSFSFFFVWCCLYFSAWSFTYTSRVGFVFLSPWEFVLHIPFCFVLFCFVFKSREFLLHIPCWIHFHRGSFSYTSRAGFICTWGVSLTHPMLASFLSGEFLLHIPGEFLPHIPYWLYFSGGGFFYTSEAGVFFCFVFSNLQSFSYTSRAGFIFYLRSFSYTSRAHFVFIGGVSFIHPVLASFLCGEFLLHIPYWRHLHLWSISYISRAGFIFIWGISLTPLIGFNLISGLSLTHNVLASSLFGGVSLTPPVLASLLSR